MEPKELFQNLMNDIVENIKKIDEMEKETSNNPKPQEENKLVTYEVTTPFGEWEIECHSMQSVCNEEDHVIFIKDNEVVAEIWDVKALIKTS